MRIAVVLLVGFLLYPSTTQAQARRTYWGIDADFVPQWQVPSSFKVLFDADEVTFKGSEFRIGFVRGRILEGDWGVAFVRKPVKDGSQVSRAVGEGCPTCGQFYTTSGASFTGVEIHKFAPFATIKQRVQIGIDGAIGFGKLTGTANETVVSLVPPGPDTTTQTAVVDASTLIAPGGTSLEYLPLGRLELRVTGILTPALKIRASGGFDFPGYSKFTVGFLYLFIR